mmetsp:Transcript_53150/g.99628  ORF Transcript_53150/g.99628 Transcript_53150/m.99628 type:complete len:575 (-) Transcript_53150:85-1809(-)
MVRESRSCCGTNLCFANNVEENADSEAAAGLPRTVFMLKREHSWPMCVFMTFGLSMCITVDILQHSMPLAFLPSVLEDRGHSPMKIATAIGVYYYTGFAGCAMIMAYQIWQLLYGKAQRNEITDYASARRYIWFLIAGLTVGAVTLVFQAMNPRLLTHTTCRFIQGMAGSFIFFYTFLLSVELFQGGQQVFAMTAASCALNVAEVVGSFVGAIMFDRWGQRSVFWFLGAVSIINQVVLLMVLSMMEGVETSVESSRMSARVQTRLSSPTGLVRTPLKQALMYEGSMPWIQKCSSIWPKRSRLLTLEILMENRWMNIASLLVIMAAVVKGSVEEMFPFHADHRWGYDPLKIGVLFLVTAVAYLIASVLIGHFWCKIGKFQIYFCAISLVMLGAVGWCVFAVAAYHKREGLLFVSLILYGVGMGLTFTPSTLLLATAIENEDGRCREVVNSIFNTMWEAGGSLGFLLGGLLAEHHQEQVNLMKTYAMLCVMTAVAILCVAHLRRDPCTGTSNVNQLESFMSQVTPSTVTSDDKVMTYGSMEATDRSMEATDQLMEATDQTSVSNGTGDQDSKNILP